MRLLRFTVNAQPLAEMIDGGLSFSVYKYE